MIPRIRRILYTTDLSENSAYVFQYALSSAREHGAKINILYVLKPMMGIIPDMIIEDVKDRRASVKAAIGKRMEDLFGQEKRDKTEWSEFVNSIEVVEGDPVVKILQTADQMNADVIIMGTHSKGFIFHTFLGSVTANVLQRSRIPVFVIPIPKEKIVD